ncbi:MAG: hypothetical protein NC924_09830 [Candidatus Omnitrophica bacterium]|nr:hypothetical protein [Candidatus Omnitrophota bacterium]
MKCAQCKKYLARFLERDLSAVEQAAAEEHLCGCAVCRQDLRRLEKMIGLLRDLGQVEPPADLMDRVNARIDSSSALARLRLFIAQPLRVAGVRVAAAAICFVIAVVVGRGIIEPPVGTQRLVKKQALAAKMRTAPAASIHCTDTMCVYPEADKQDFEPAAREDKKSEFSGTAALSGEGVVEFAARPVVSDVFEPKSAAADGVLLVSSKVQISAVPDHAAFSEPLSPARKMTLAAEKSKEIHLRPPIARQETVSLEQAGLVSANERQHWQAKPPHWQAGIQELERIFDEFNIRDVSRNSFADNGREGMRYFFSLAYGQIGAFLKRGERLGVIMKLTPLPQLLPEAYRGPGGINPRVLEEQIDIELVLLK